MGEMAENNYRQRVQNSIEFIEANLKEDLSLQVVSLQANASLYHFHRLFRAFVGESLKEYIRHRRLACAACDLLTTKESIIDIALDYRYSTPESFLRAFKSRYGVTPRKDGHFLAAHQKVDLLAQAKHPLKGGIQVEPRICEREPWPLFGTLIHTRHGACKKEVAGLWARARRDTRIGEIARAAGADSMYGACFGVCDGCGTTLETDEEQFPYIIGWEARKGDRLPDGLVEMTIPGGTYAVFTVEGNEADIQNAIDRIYGTWLPASSRELSDSPVLEKYGTDWTGSQGSSMEIWLPIR